MEFVKVINKGRRGGGGNDSEEETPAVDAVPAEGGAERAFELVMMSISSEPAMSGYKSEYGKILASLKESFSSERRLMLKVKVINNQLKANREHMQAALRLSEDDSSTIEELRVQAERSFALMEKSAAKADAQTQAIAELTERNQAVTLSLNHYTDLIGVGRTVEDIVAAKESLAARLETAQNVIASESVRSEALVAELNVRSKKYKEKKDEITKLFLTLKRKDENLAQAGRVSLSLQGDIVSLKEQIADKMTQMTAHQRATEMAEGAKEKLLLALDAEKSRTSAALSDLSTSKSSAARSFDEAILLKERLMSVAESSKALKDELYAAKNETAKESVAATRSRLKIESLGKELEFAKTGLARADEGFAALRSELTGMDKNVQEERATAKDLEFKALRLTKDKAAAEQKAATANVKTGTVQLESAARATKVILLEAECKSLTVDLQKMRLVVASLELERTKSRSDSQAMINEISNRDDVFETKILEAKQLEKREVEAQALLKSMTLLFESSRNERNKAVKALTLGNEETSEFRRKMKIVEAQLDSLKAEIWNKEKMLITEQFEVAALSKRLDHRAIEVDATRRLLHEASENVARQNLELGSSHLALRRADADMVMQKRSFDHLIAERDALAAVLTRRNDEMALLHERNTIQSITLSNGETQYQAATDECKFMCAKIAELKRDAAVASTNSVGGMAELKRQLMTALKDHASEKIKVRERERERERERDPEREARGSARMLMRPRALGTKRLTPPPSPPPPQVNALLLELENPQIIHRWRKLEGSDPELLDLISRYASLQKRLILKTEEVVERDIIVAEREITCAELKARLASAPGSDMLEQLSATQNALNERTRQLKVLASEANMFQTQASESRHEADRLARELQDSKRFMLDTKKKTQPTTPQSVTKKAAAMAAAGLGSPVAFELLGGSPVSWVGTPALFGSPTSLNSLGRTR